MVVNLQGAHQRSWSPAIYTICNPFSCWTKADLCGRCNLIDVIVRNAQSWVIKAFKHLAWSFGSLAEGKSTCCVVRLLKKSHGDAHMERICLVSTSWPAMWVSPLRSGSFSPSHVFRWLKTQLNTPHERPWARDAQQSCSQIPGLYILTL